MSQVFKTFLSIFIIFSGAFILIGVITADLNVSSARSYHNDVVNEIECSNMSDTVISECISNAENNYGYKLIANKIKNNQDITVAVEVILEYKYSIPFLNISTDHQIRGYAR